MSEETNERQRTLGAGLGVNKVVPRKRLKNAHRKAKTGLSLKAWATKQPHLADWWHKWRKNKQHLKLR